MYAVITREDVQIPTVISENDKTFPEYLMSGWEIVSEGTKREMAEVAQIMLENIFY